MTRQSNARPLPLNGNAMLAALDVIAGDLEKVKAENKALNEKLHWQAEKEHFHDKIMGERNAAHLENFNLRAENKEIKAELEAAKREADYLRTILSAVQIEVVEP
jgi:hypothetical protein